MTERSQRRKQRLIGGAVAASVLLAAGDGFAYTREQARERAQTVAAAQEMPARSPVVVIVHMTSVTGTITHVGGDDAGAPQAIGIVSPDRLIYLVGDEGAGKDLKQLVGRTVTVAAEVKHDVDGWPYLAIQWFRVLEG